MDRPPMKVYQLIAALTTLPDKVQLNYEVSTEGCDCWGDVGHLDVRSDVVLLCRTDRYGQDD